MEAFVDFCSPKKKPCKTPKIKKIILYICSPHSSLSVSGCPFLPGPGPRLQRQSAVDSVLVSTPPVFASPGLSPAPFILVTPHTQPPASPLPSCHLTDSPTSEIAQFSNIRKPSCPSPHLLSPPLRRMSTPTGHKKSRR